MTKPSLSTRLELAAELDLVAAVPLRDMLVEALDAAMDLTLDGSKVERVSTACLQILVVAARQAGRADLAFSIISPSAVLAGAVQDLALHDVLPLRN